MLANYLKKYRRKHNYSTDDMAKKVGVSYLTYWRWEHGKIPSYKATTKLAETLHLTVGELVEMYEEDK